VNLSRFVPAAFAGVLLAAGCATSPPPAREAALPLANPGFEDALTEGSHCPDGWGCVMHANPKSYRFRLDEGAPAVGKKSLCIEPLAREPWARAVQTSFDQKLRGKRVRFSVMVRTEGAEAGNSELGGGAYIAAMDGGGRYLGSRSSVTKATQWQRVEAELVVPPQMVVLEYGVVLNGPGRVCADEAQLVVLPN
jgi:hypothetical protein